MKKVMAFGTFDHFHAGHESYLRQAKILGESLIVVVARDKTVKCIKGRFPNKNERERLQDVKQSAIADKAVLGSTSNKYDIIKKYRPHAIALGYDQFAFTFRLGKFLIDNKMDTKIIRLNPYKPNLYKTSLLREAPLIQTHA